MSHHEKKQTIITKYALSAETIASGDGTQVGSDIPAGMNRYITGMIFGSDSGAVDQLELMLGDSSDNDRETLALLPVAADSGAQVIGSFDTEKPIFVARPNWAAGVETKNAIYIAHKTAGIDVTLTYFDAP